MKDDRWTFRSTEWKIKRVYDQLEGQNVVGEATLWGDRERFGQG